MYYLITLALIFLSLWIFKEGVLSKSGILMLVSAALSWITAVYTTNTLDIIKPDSTLLQYNLYITPLFWGLCILSIVLFFVFIFEESIKSRFIR